MMRAGSLCSGYGGLELGAAQALGELDLAWYEPAISRWENMLGRPAPEPTVPGRRGQRVLSAEWVEWLMGLPPGHVTGVLPERADALRALGNGVVPQQAALALRVLLTDRHLEEAA